MIEPFHKTFRDIEGDYASVCWVTRLQNSVMLEAGAYDDSEEGARCVQGGDDDDQTQSGLLPLSSIKKDDIP